MNALPVCDAFTIDEHIRLSSHPQNLIKHLIWLAISKSLEITNNRAY